MNDFYAARAEGHKLEDTIIDALSFRGLQAWRNPAPEDDYEGRCAYDVAVSSGKGNYTIESKMDFLSATTGNICIERPTLDHSQADFFIFGLPYLHVFTREEIEKAYTMGRVKLVGDQKIPAALVHKSVTHELGRSLKDFIYGLQ